MKKKFLMIIGLFIVMLTGCELGNTPTARVEEFLSKYQRLDDDISISYVDLSDDTDVDDELRERYVKLIRKQYQGMSYEVKDESIDGESALVKVQIEVMDYASIIEEYDKNSLGENYHIEVVKALEKAKEKVAYTIEFNVLLDEDGNWEVQPLTMLEREKILGINMSSSSYT